MGFGPTLRYPFPTAPRTSWLTITKYRGARAGRSGGPSDSGAIRGHQVKAADAEPFESGESPSGTPSVSVRADFGLALAEPDAITSLEARTRHLGAADQDPIDNAEVHDLHDLHVRREPGDHQFGLTV